MSLTAWQQRWIDTVIKLNDGDDWLTAHYVFCRKVLREPRLDSMQLAAAFRHVPLDKAKCERVADGWDDA